MAIFSVNNNSKFNTSLSRIGNGFQLRSFAVGELVIDTWNGSLRPAIVTQIIEPKVSLVDTGIGFPHRTRSDYFYSLAEIGEANVRSANPMFVYEFFDDGVNSALTVRKA